MSRRIDRILRANWPGHTRVKSAGFEGWVNQIASKAFPGLLPEVQVIPIRSRFRNWQVIESDKNTYHIIADLEYTDLLSQIDFIIMNKSDFGGAFQEIYATALNGWVYLFLKDYRRALILLGSANEKKRELSVFQSIVNQRKGRSITGLFVLLHELSHFIVDNEIEYDQEWGDFVSTRFRKSIEATKSLYNGIIKGESVKEGYKISGIPEDKANKELLLAQLEKYLDNIENDTEIRREIMCDVIALIGLLSLKTEYDVLNKGIPSKNNYTVKEIGDFIVVGYRTLKAMQVIGMLKSEAQAIKDHMKPGEISYGLILQTVRQNVIGDICGLILKLFYQSADLKNDIGNSDEAIDNAFLSTIDIIQRRSMNRLIIPSSNTNVLMRDESMLLDAEKELRENLKLGSLDELELQLFVQEVYRSLPI